MSNCTTNFQLLLIIVAVWLSGYEFGRRKMTALDLIRKGWTQKAFARDKDGKPVYSGSPEAVAWCPMGAIGLAYTGSPAMSDIFKKLETVIGPQPGNDGLMSPITTWNDAPERTHQEVIDAFEKAGI